MSAVPVTKITCDGCGWKAYAPKASVPAGRQWAADWRNHSTFIGEDGNVRDLCGTCTDAANFVGVSVLIARPDVIERVAERREQAMRTALTELESGDLS